MTTKALALRGRSCRSGKRPVVPDAYGRKYFGNERTTFIVDSGGKIAEVLRKVKPAEHDEKVLVALADAGAARRVGSFASA